MVADEELASCRIGIAGPCHGDGSPFMAKGILDPVCRKLAADGIAGAADSRPVGIPALDHESLDDTVEGQSVVKALACEVDEIVAGVAGVFLADFDDDVAVSFDLERNHSCFLRYRFPSSILSDEALDDEVVGEVLAAVEPSVDKLRPVVLEKERVTFLEKGGGSRPVEEADLLPVLRNPADLVVLPEEGKAETFLGIASLLGIGDDLDHPSVIRLVKKAVGILGDGKGAVFGIV